ncbi:MAG: DUF998 domain-containing protein [Chloroflexota bacterium]
MFYRSRPRTIAGPLNILGILALSGVAGPLVLIITDLTAAFSEPGYNLIRDSISHLALTPMGWVQTIGFLAIGLLVEIFVAGLLFGIRGKRGFGLSIGLLVCFGFGLLLIGAFRMDPVGTAPTIEGTIHTVTATTAFWIFPGALLLLAPSLRNDPFWRKLFNYTIDTCVVAFALIAGWSFLPDQASWFGLYERILVANMVIWIEVMAIWLLRLSLRHQRTAEKDSPISTRLPEN